MAEFQLLSLTEITAQSFANAEGDDSVVDNTFATTNDSIWGVGVPPASKGDVVRYNERHWLALNDIDGAYADVPNETDGNWADIGPSDRLAAFDIQVGTDQERVTDTVVRGTGGDLSLAFAPGPKATGYAFFGLKAASVRVQAVKDGVTVHDETRAMRNVENYGGSLYRYLNTPPRLENSFANFDVNIAAGAVFNVSFDRPGYTPEVASICVGRSRRYGTVADQSSREIVSRSVIQNDGITTTLVRRTPSARTKFEVTLTKSSGEGLYRALEDVDGVAAVYGATDARSDLLTFGFHTNVRRSHLVNGVSRMTIEAEEL